MAGRKQVFTDASLFPSVDVLLKRSLAESECDSPVYLFMPDHAHVVLQGASESSDLWRCLVRFKQYSGYLLGQSSISARWQKDFYDHILRRDEDLARHVRYILDNPDRKRLVDNWKVYPFKGSTVYNLEDW
ncbi:MAG: transposase [Nitrospirae bacterium]|nr:transposase [Nitrospirota bacterium]